MAELVPVQKPLPCYSLEYNKADPRCQECPHQDGCILHSGSRAYKIPVSRVTFKLVPEAYHEAYNIDLEDPELPHIQRSYFNCYEAVFSRSPSDDMTRFSKEVVDAARSTQCSLQMYMLAVMVGHRQAQKIRMEKTGQALPRPFRAKMLTGAVARKHANMYMEMCSNEFGTFALAAMSSLVNEDFDASTIEKKMLHSEVTAGKFIVGYKMRNGGPPWEALFDAQELTLDPYWLAIDNTYWREIFEPYQKEKRGTEAIKQHRFSVGQVMGHLKGHRTAAINAFRARESIMGKAIVEVLNYYGYRGDDFIIDPEQITEPLEFWVFLGRAFQHFQCLLYLEGERSIFTPR